MTTHKDDVDKIVSLFQLYEQKMYHIAYAILHDSHQAEDAVMDSFIRLLDHNYAIDDPSSNETKRLVIRIIRSSSIDLYRKNQRQREMQTLSENPVSLAPVKTTDLGFSFGNNVESMIRGLPKNYRDVIYLKYAKEYTTAETANTLGISEEAVRKRQERALRMLKQEYSKKGSCYGEQFKVI